MNYEDNYFDYIKNVLSTKVLYGMGSMGKTIAQAVNHIDFFCDKRAQVGQTLYGIPVIKPEDLKKIQGEIDILICIQDKIIRQQVKEELERLDIRARIFDAYNNSAFDLFEPQYNMNQISRKHDIQYVRIVNRGQGWILEKFARKMKEQLEKKGIRAEIDEISDPKADMNYYTFYGSVNNLLDENNTFMITHINCRNSIDKIKHSLKKSQMGICMSRETMEMLVQNGVPREKLCYINPAQDGLMKPKKYVLGITHRCYDGIDHRKRADALIDILSEVDPAYFEVKIMGAGWEKIISVLRDKGLHINYYPEFDREIYEKLIPSLDYYLYWGFDEGSMGVLDALAAGVKTIVTPQGFHLDIKNGITYPCRKICDFKNTLKQLENERKMLVNSVSDWTWDNFTQKHIEVWNYLLGINDNYYRNQHAYEDGIFSVMPINIGL